MKVAVLISLLCCLWLGLAEGIVQMFQGAMDIMKILPGGMPNSPEYLKSIMKIVGSGSGGPRTGGIQEGMGIAPKVD